MQVGFILLLGHVLLALSGVEFLHFLGGVALRPLAHDCRRRLMSKDRNNGLPISVENPDKLITDITQAMQ